LRVTTIFAGLERPTTTTTALVMTTGAQNIEKNYSGGGDAVLPFSHLNAA
jgi:hypothetical protein